jgi:hypothetical protein
MLHGEPIGHAAPGRPEVLRLERNGRSCVAKQAEPNHPALVREEAALRLLGPEFAPELIEGSAAAGYLIMEDLGSAEQQLGKMLFAGCDREPLLRMMRSLAKLHAATLGREAEWRGGAPGSTHKIFRLAEAVSAMPPRTEARRLLEWLENRDGWYGLVHGDATAANCFVLADRVVWFDFETADFRRTALDAAFPGIRYLHSVWARNLSVDWRREATAAYRDAFIEPERFDEEFQAANAAWLAGILMFRERVEERDVQWGHATLRQRIVAACEQFRDLQADRWPAWTEMAAAIAAECRANWGDCDLLPY